MYLKVSTAATIKLGPFVDSTDGATAETALTISQADIRLSKNGGDIAQSNNAAGATHDELGYYDIPLDATDTNTVGRLRVIVSESGALPVWQDFFVLPANVFDSLLGNDLLDVNATQWAGAATDSGDVALIAAPANLAALAITAGGAVTAGTVSDKTGYSLSSAGVQAIWDALTSALTTVGSIGKLLVDNINATISSRSSHSAADVWASGTRTLTSFGTLVADIWANVTRTLTSGGGASAADVWAYAVRTLTQVLVSTDNTNPTNTLTTRRGDYYSKSLTDLGNITAYTKLWLDVKETEDGLQPDDDALIQIVVGSGFATTGLIYLNGDTAGSNAWGSLTVDDEATADITIVLEADATVLLPPGRYFYGLKALVAGNPTTLVTGVFIVLPGYTAAVS